MIRKYNRNIPAALPPNRMLKRSTVGVNPVVDTRQFCGSVNDQTTEGCCTGEGGTEACEWIVRKYYPHLGPLKFSPQFTYVEELKAQGSFPQDVGSDGTTLCNVLISAGCCELSVWPFVAGQIVEPSAEQLANAATHKIVGAYHGLVGSDTAISVLADPTPWPVLVGFTVYESFESQEVEETGVYKPQPGESVLGGHEVLMVGYDIGASPTIRPKNCPPAALIQNSWGEDWGLKGFFWMALPVLDDSQTDLKIAHAGHPWVTV